MSEEKWVLKQRMHLGFARETFGVGTVIVHDTKNDILKISGRTFEDTRDLPILKAKKWVVAWSEETEAQYAPVPLVSDEDDGEDLTIEVSGMKIVQSDEDLMGDDIDISHTKTPKKEAKRTDKMEVIRGDETVEERLAHVQERVEIPIVSEEEAGGFETSGPSLNSGQPGADTPKAKVAKSKAPKTVKNAKRRGRPRKKAVKSGG